MKKLYRSLGYHDRHEVDYRLRVFVGAFIAIGLLINSRKDYVNFRNLENRLALRDYQCTDELFTIMNDMDQHRNNIFHILGVWFPLVILLAGTGLFFSTVVSRNRVNGWNRYLRALPVSPAMRADSMCITRARQLGISTLIALVVSVALCALLFGTKPAVALIPVILIITLIVETADMIISPLAVWMAFRAEPARAESESFSVGLLTLSTLAFVLVKFVCPDNCAWMDYLEHSEIAFLEPYTYNARWLLILALCAALNIIGYLLLKKVLEKKAG